MVGNAAPNKAEAGSPTNPVAQFSATGYDAATTQADQQSAQIAADAKARADEMAASAARDTEAARVATEAYNKEQERIYAEREAAAKARKAEVETRAVELKAEYEREAKAATDILNPLYEKQKELDAATLTEMRAKQTSAEFELSVNNDLAYRKTLESFSKLGIGFSSGFALNAQQLAQGAAYKMAELKYT